MSNIEQFARDFSKVAALLALTAVSACATRTQSPNSQYTFTSADPQASIVAFMASCTIDGITANIAGAYIDHASWAENAVKPHENSIQINCNTSPQLKTLILPAGNYVFSGVGVMESIYITYSSKPSNTFSFALKPHKLTYLGKINFEITKDHVITTVASGDPGDAVTAEIHQTVPLIPPHDYIIPAWEKNWLNDFTAK